MVIKIVIWVMLGNVVLLFTHMNPFMNMLYSVVVTLVKTRR